MANRFDMSEQFDELANDLILEHKRKLAQAIAERAGTIPPVVTGNYRDSLKGLVIDGRVVVTSNDPGAVVIESGSSKMQGYAPLRRAAAELAKLDINPKPGRDRGNK